MYYLFDKFSSILTFLYHESHITTNTTTTFLRSGPKVSFDLVQKEMLAITYEELSWHDRNIIHYGSGVSYSSSRTQWYA